LILSGGSVALAADEWEKRQKEEDKFVYGFTELRGGGRARANKNGAKAPRPNKK